MSGLGNNRAEHTAPLEPDFSNGEDGGDILATDQTVYINTGDRAYQRFAERGPLMGLEARGVSAWFGTHKVLERVDLAMGAGEVTALIGPSGCGKSTFLRILNRMHELVPGAQLAGEVLLDGEDIYDPGQRATEIRAPHRHGLPEAEPVPGHVDLRQRACRAQARRHQGAARQGRPRRDSLRRAGLWNEVKDRLGSPGGALSGGQQQRLCIARALAVSPRGAAHGRAVLGARPDLDPAHRGDDRRDLRDQVTVVIVTHNMQQAQRVSDHCAFFLAAREHPRPHRRSRRRPSRSSTSPSDPRTADYVHGRFG